MDYDGPPGWRLDAYLRERLRPFSRTRWRDWVREGRVLVNGRRVSPSRRMSAGDRLEVHHEVAGPPPPAGGLRIIHEDADLIAVCKDSGILVHPVRLMTRDTVIGWLRQTHPDARPCHRLDKLTSGIVLLALHAQAARALQEAFVSGQVRKQYLAIVEGSVADDELTIDAPIGPDKGSPVHIKRCVDPAGEPSVTRFRVLERVGGHSLLLVNPESGRKHQIRVHLSHLGHPIVGDLLYGRRMDVGYFEDKNVNLARDSRHWLALHAGRLEVPHPGRGGQPLVLEAEPPRRFMDLLSGLRKQR
ncbi:MAG: RluA family pseudouridine synthase [Candidatus Riflebacteria bacterium]|nr:RluA family pseudouridine synthase [Candidatus Riflebacteria bacterium]